MGDRGRVKNGVVLTGHPMEPPEGAQVESRVVDPEVR